MKKHVLKAQKRKVFGRKVKRLRNEGILPANIYGKKVKSEAVQVNTPEFEKVFKKAGETGVVELQVNGRKSPVLIHSLQVHPVTDEPIHADFLQVDLKEKVSADVPVELIGESPAEKQGLGTVVQYIDEVEVEALPGDLPDKFDVDLSSLSKVDQVVQVKDLSVDKKKIEIKVAADQMIVKVEPPRKEEEVAPPEEEMVTEEEAVPPEAAPSEVEEKAKAEEIPAVEVKAGKSEKKRPEEKKKTGSSGSKKT